MATNCYDITYLIWEARATGKRFYRWNNVRYDEKGDALNGRMMDNDINQLIDALLKKQTSLGRVYFAGETRSPAEPVVQVDFPRLNILLDGQLPDQALGDNAPPLEANDVLYIPGDSWNCPQWQAPCLLLSILFAKQQLECSLQHWNGKAITVVDKRQALRRGPRVGSFCCRRSMNSGCNRRSSKPPAASSSACSATAMIFWQPGANLLAQPGVV